MSSLGSVSLVNALKVMLLEEKTVLESSTAVGAESGATIVIFHFNNDFLLHLSVAIAEITQMVSSFTIGAV